MVVSKAEGRLISVLMAVQVVLTTILLGLALAQTSKQAQAATNVATLNNRALQGIKCVLLILPEDRSDEAVSQCFASKEGEPAK